MEAPEAWQRFGQGSIQRQVVAGRLIHIHRLASATGHLARLVVFGSCVTAKAHPRDLDRILVMEDTFDLETVVDESAVIF